MRDDRSAYDPPSMREHRRELRSRGTTRYLLVVLLSLAVGIFAVASIGAVTYWEALGR